MIQRYRRGGAATLETLAEWDKRLMGPSCYAPPWRASPAHMTLLEPGIAAMAETLRQRRGILFGAMLTDPVDPIDETMLARIRALHDASTRAYHGWSHIVALLALFEETKDALHDPQAVHAAILLHDAVYDARAGDNEARSAALAETLLEGFLPAASLARTVRLIDATAAHAIPPGLDHDEVADMGRFLDMDLGILGASDAAFDRYEAGVRLEYGHVPDDAFRAGRAAILERFLARDPLFFSAWGCDRFEQKARANLRRSIAALRKGA